MHTSSPFADDVFVSGAAKRGADDQHFTWFIIPVAAPGVRVVARKTATRHPHPEVAPLSHRYDELDAQLWLEDVFVPFERVFTAESPLGAGASGGQSGGPVRTTNLVGWLLWHQHHGWLAKLEFSLGLALASLELMGARSNPGAVNQVIDMLVEVQTARTCMTAAECDPDTTDGGFLLPGQAHLASASLHSFRIRQQVTETLRRLPGSSLVMSPAPSDFEDAAMAAGLEDALGGGGYSARQRAALMNLIWDNVSSGLDGRESTYEMHANGGVSAWRLRLRSAFKDYNALANGVLKTLAADMPKIDVSSIGGPQSPASAPGAPVTPSAPAEPKLKPPSGEAAGGQWLGEGVRPSAGRG
jgi:4-hydroxyphenylacetate 3-monooxygenase